jgi:hypothetical protein
MKFSSSTLATLKNFSAINQNILLREGSELTTISTGKNIFATAIIPETIPQECAIYDLNSFLALLSLTTEPEIEFGEKSMTITNKTGGEFEYYFSDPAIIVSPPQKKIVLDEHFVFNITKEEVTTMLKAAAVMSVPNLSIIAKSGKVFLTVGDPKVAASNSYKKQIGSTTEDGTFTPTDFEGEDFNVTVAVENIKIIPNNYQVTISKKKLIHFSNESVKYWIAASPQSVI